MSKPFAYYSLVISILIVGMGVFIMVNPPAPLSEPQAPSAVPYIFGTLLAAYGFFRFSRALKAINEAKKGADPQNEEEEDQETE